MSVWGFRGDQCLKKLEWQENTSVDALVFTPDGASLAVASQGPMTPYDDYTAARLRCLRLVPEQSTEGTTAAAGNTEPSRQKRVLRKMQPDKPGGQGNF